jgi:hypothetical protein
MLPHRQRHAKGGARVLKGVDGLAAAQKQDAKRVSLFRVRCRKYGVQQDVTLLKVAAPSESAPDAYAFGKPCQTGGE